MPRFRCGCYLSRKKRKSFPIHEKQRPTKDAKETKVFIKHVENIRLSPPPINKKPTSKATIKKKIDEMKSNTGTQKQTTKEKKSSDNRAPASKIFQKLKQNHTPSPVPEPISVIPEQNDAKTNGNSSSSSTSSSSTSTSTSTSTNTEIRKKKKQSKHRSYADSYDVSKEFSSTRKSAVSSKTKTNDQKTSAKSKLVLENVRKMIKDQNIQEQHFNEKKQKESARL